MKRVLMIYYSQSGEVAQVVKRFAARLEAAGAALTVEAIRPRADYPYPWKSVRRFFDAMPETITGQAPEIEPPQFDRRTGFDLVIIVYPVWFLSPAPPIQGFFRSDHAAVLRDTEVITVSVSRAMWQQASLTMKRLLAAAGAVHCDNVVVTHQGSAILTLVSTPRALLFGKSDRLAGVFPRPGVSETDLARVDGLATVLAERLDSGRPPGGSFLRGEAAVSVKTWLVIPELLGWYCFYGWAVLIRRLGKIHPALRAAGDYGFALFLVLMILLALPVVLLGSLLAYPLIRRRVTAYALRLAAPTGGSETTP
jgi:hypothetical protein